MEKDELDALLKATVAMTKLTRAIDALCQRIDAGNGPPELGVVAKVSKPLPDRHDRANLDFAVRYGHFEEEKRLREKFNWDAKPARGE